MLSVDFIFRALPYAVIAFVCAGFTASMFVHARKRQPEPAIPLDWYYYVTCIFAAIVVLCTTNFLRVTIDMSRETNFRIAYLTLWPVALVFIAGWIRWRGPK